MKLFIQNKQVTQLRQSDKRARKLFKPPRFPGFAEKPIEEVKTYCKQCVHDLEDQFNDYYEENGGPANFAGRCPSWVPTNMKFLRKSYRKHQITGPLYVSPRLAYNKIRITKPEAFRRFYDCEHQTDPEFVPTREDIQNLKAVAQNVPYKKKLLNKTRRRQPRNIVAINRPIPMNPTITRSSAGLNNTIKRHSLASSNFFTNGTNTETYFIGADTIKLSDFFTVNFLNQFDYYRIKSVQYKAEISNISASGTIVPISVWTSIDLDDSVVPSASTFWERQNKNVTVLTAHRPMAQIARFKPRRLITSTVDDSLKVVAPNEWADMRASAGTDWGCLKYAAICAIGPQANPDPADPMSILLYPHITVEFKGQISI